MSNSVTSLNNPTRRADSSNLTIQVTVLRRNVAGELDVVKKWTLLNRGNTADQAVTFSDADRETNENIARQVLQHFPNADVKSIGDMVLVRVSGRTAGQVSAVAFAMIRLRNTWMVSSTEAGSVILAKEPTLYNDIREEMISGGIASKDDRFQQMR